MNRKRLFPNEPMKSLSELYDETDVFVTEQHGVDLARRVVRADAFDQVGTVDAQDEHLGPYLPEVVFGGTFPASLRTLCLEDPRLVEVPPQTVRSGSEPGVDRRGVQCLRGLPAAVLGPSRGASPGPEDVFLVPYASTGVHVVDVRRPVQLLVEELETSLVWTLAEHDGYFGRSDVFPPLREPVRFVVGRRHGDAPSFPPHTNPLNDFCQCPDRLDGLC